ncbi:YdcH family protein [Parvularcula dongshanensis]|uniref:DUF465 domain-containing protein n=1 Tax=Parvularcula dongshanensis TaxID=1173995 RepID=A0A840I3R0_9PROT|nr:DUF465 domain-containing protein [Parvularcula dongshanensis]MBB4659417.1 hypothetical protein [Parvularcula dongshanensis]
MTRDKPPHLTAIDGDRKDEEGLPVEDVEEGTKAANDEAIRMRIRRLEEEHRDLDQAIATMEERMPYDRLTIQRLKKRKLALKDQISELHEQILPDIIA